MKKNRTLKMEKGRKGLEKRSEKKLKEIFHVGKIVKKKKKNFLSPKDERKGRTGSN